jgi:protein-disulfide isomerase
MEDSVEEAGSLKPMSRFMPRLTALVLALGVSGCKSENQASDEQPVRIDIERFRVDLRDDDYALGGSHPLVTAVVFSDYACGPCGRTWSVMDNLVEDYGDDLRVVFRSMTVPGFVHGEQAAEAAFAAGRQGKFWEMHRRLFKDSHGFDRPTLRAHAEALGLEVERFQDDIDTGAEAGRRSRDRRQAKSLGLLAAPVVFVNGLPVVGFKDEPTWHALIDEEVKRARRMIREGTPRAKIYDVFMNGASTRPLDKGEGVQELRKQLADAKARKPATTKAPEPDKRYAIVPGDRPSLGPKDAPVVVVEFVDFQCPYCRKAWQESLVPLRQRFPKDVRLAIVHLPLEIHTAARGAAEAAVAAGRQGKFWDFHDRLFSREGSLGRSVFVEIAREIGLDVDRFQKDLDNPEVAEIVAKDVQLARRVGVRATPGFFINGKFYPGFQQSKAMAAIVEKELELAMEKIAAGVPRAEVFAAIMRDAVPEAEFPNP